MKRAVIFDLDGVLIDSEMTAYTLFVDLLKPYGYSFDLDDYLDHYSGKSGESNMRSVIANYQLPLSIEEAMAFLVKREQENIEKGIPLKAGVKEILPALKEKGSRIVLASSSLRARAETLLAQNGVLSYFDDMVFGPEVSHGKPFPDIYLKACELVGLPTTDCLIVEDSEAGIQAAAGAGVDVLCVPDLRRPESDYCAMAMAVLPSLYEVVPFLEIKGLL